MDFARQHVVVTGGAGALGTAVVGLLRQRGASCHVPVFKVADKGRSPFAHDRGVTFADSVDLTDEAQVESFYASLPGLSASIHLAGGFAMRAIEQTAKADLLAQLNVNLVTAFLCCREAVKHLRAAGASGRIVNVAARPALEPRTGARLAAYTASKAGVAAMTEALAEEVAGDGIWVNAVVPSILDTQANRAAMPKADHSRWPGVDEVAETIVFLASANNKASRGALVPVYGRS